MSNTPFSSIDKSETPPMMMAGTAPTHKLKRDSKRASLNLLVLRALSHKHAFSTEKALTARDVRDFIYQQYGVFYTVQTLLIVLNRFVKKTQVIKFPKQSEGKRTSYHFYMLESLSELRRKQLLQGLKPLLKQTFQNDTVAFLQCLHSITLEELSHVED